MTDFLKKYYTKNIKSSYTHHFEIVIVNIEVCCCQIQAYNPLMGSGMKWQINHPFVAKALESVLSQTSYINSSVCPVVDRLRSVEYVRNQTHICLLQCRQRQWL